MTTRRPLRLLAALVAVLALAGAACSDDGGDEDTSSTSTTEGSTTTDDPAAPTGDDDATEPDDDTTEPDDDDSTTTAPEDDDTTTTGPDETRGGGDLASRLPDIEGYEREPDDDDDGDSGFTDEHCDGSTPSLQPAEEASADYESEGDGDTSQDILAIAAVRFASEDEASTAFDEFVDTTSGCSNDDIEVDEGTSTDIGDEGMSWGLAYDGQVAGSIYISRVGDELWFLSLFGASGTVDEAVLTAYAAAAEG